MTASHPDDHWRQALVAAAAAERSMAVIELAGRPASVSTGRAVLDETWGRASGRSKPPDHALEAQIDKLPEARQVDAAWPIEAVQGGLLLIRFAARLLWAERVDPSDREDSADVWSAFDGIEWELAGGGPRFIDPRNPPPPDEWEAAEAEQVRRDELVAASGAPLEDVANQLRSEAIDRRLHLAARIGPLLRPLPRRWP